MSPRPHRLHLVAPTAWPEAPAPDYVRPMTPQRMAQATADFDMIEALRDEHWRQQILMRQLRDDRRFRARMWIMFFIAFGIIAGTLIAYVAHQETASHVRGPING